SLRNRGAGEDRIGAIEKISDPACARFQHHHLQCRKTIEHAQLEKRGEGMLHAMTGEQAEVPRRPSKVVIAMEHSPGRRLNCRMNCQGQSAILRRREDPIVREVAMGARVIVNGATKAPLQPSLAARSSSRAASSGSPSERWAIGISRPPESRQKSAI